MNGRGPLISIGMPVYNGANFVGQALESMLNQTFQDFELIISDNASTDETLYICQSYLQRDQRLRLVQNPSNLGAAANYNRLVALAAGQYFKWAAHDDVCAPEFLEKCTEVLEHDSNVVLCYSRSYLIDGSGSIVGHYADDLHLRSMKPHQRFHRFFDRQGLCHAVFGMMRTNVLLRTGLIGNFAMSDRVLIGELSLHGQIHELSDQLFFRRVHPLTSTEANTTDNQIATWFDPAQSNRLVLPKWRRLKEYFRAINRAPLSWLERLQCYFELARFGVYPRRWIGLGTEVSRSAQVFLLRMASFLNGRSGQN